MKLKKPKLKGWHWALICIIGLFLYWKFINPAELTVTKARYYTAFVVMFTLLVFELDDKMRIHSPKFISETHHGTTDSRVFEVGAYYVMIKDNIDYGIHETKSKMYNTGTYIFPKYALQRIGHSIAVNVHFFDVPLDYLPPHIQDFINTNKFLKAPYLFGFCTSEQYNHKVVKEDYTELGIVEKVIPDNVIVSTIVQELIQASKFITELRAMLNLKFGTHGEIAEEVSRIRSKYARGDSMIGRLIPWGKKDDREYKNE